MGMPESINPLEIDADLAEKILEDFIHSEITRAGFKHAVMGVSGGIDSALSCCLACRALGPDNVLAVFMPYSTTSPETTAHAQEVIEWTGARSVTIDITPLADPLLNLIPKSELVRRGNVLARIRMIILYDQSVEFKGLVVGTGNKTEILLGYTTLYGDAACALNPIGDLYKTQVRQLARAVGIPEEIISKPPSADLWAGQTDEGELGFTYEEVDRLLVLLVDGRYSPGECIEAGFDPVFVDAVIKRMRNTQFKRLLPPIAKLSNRTVGYDFLYLRDWGT
jgi:NAD+ synthase